MFNSAVIAGVSTLIAMVLSIPAAFACSRRTFRSKETILVSLLGVRMLPAAAIALPVFLLFSRGHLLDTYTGIILLHSALSIPLAVWILKVFFDSVPQVIDDASRLDGDSEIGVVVRQILPLSLPGVFTAAAFCFVNSWNELFLALVVTGPKTRPLTVAIPALVTPHGTYWGQVAAIATAGYCLRS